MWFSCINRFFPLLCILWLLPYCFLGCRSLHHHRSAPKKANSGLLAINALRSVAADCLCILGSNTNNSCQITAKGSITFCKRTFTTLRWLMPGWRLTYIPNRNQWCQPMTCGPELALLSVQFDPLEERFSTYKTYISNSHYQSIMILF